MLRALWLLGVGVEICFAEAEAGASCMMGVEQSTWMREAHVKSALRARGVG